MPKERKLTDEERLAAVEQNAREFVRDVRATDNHLFNDGSERLDPLPVAPPLGYKREPSMFDHMRSLVRSELLRAAVSAQDFETFEEADDFEVDDDDFPSSPFEVQFDQYEVPYAVPRAAPGAEPPTEGAPPSPPQSSSAAPSNPSPGTPGQGGAGGPPPASETSPGAAPGAPRR